MKKFSLLILSVLLLSCSSDDEDAKEGNFLEVYNGVVWKYPKVSGNPPEYGNWVVFTTESYFNAEYSDRYGCLKDTYKWGIDVDGVIFTVQENSENKLVLIDTYQGITEIHTYTTSNDGKVLNYTYIENKVEYTNKMDRVTLSATEPC